MSQPAPQQRTWPPSELLRFRAMGDPPADGVVAAVMQSSGPDAVNQLMATLVRNDQPPSEQLPSEVRDYLDGLSSLPDWADRDKMSIAAELFGTWGLEIGTALFCASLPTAYAMGNGVQVLQHTARLQTDTKRRILETGQFLMDVSAPDAFEPGGQGFRVVQKVRLMHATVRHVISSHLAQIQRDAADVPPWSAEWGVPINQHDMAGTMLSFSIVPSRILPKIGVRLETSELDAYVHRWSVIGHLMGVDDELLPQTAAEGETLADAIEASEFRSTPAGVQLTAALVEMMDGLSHSRAFDGIPPSMIRHLAGTKIADALEVPAYSVMWRLTSLPRYVLGLLLGDLAKHHRLSKVAAPFGRDLLTGMLDHERGGDRATFAMPLEFERRWDIVRTSDGSR